MKYILKKDLPLAKAGTEVKISCWWIVNINNNAITKIDEKDITEWLEEVKEVKTIYDIKWWDIYWSITDTWVVWKYFYSGVNWDIINPTNMFLTEREAKRNKLLRELATREKWIPKVGDKWTDLKWWTHIWDLNHWEYFDIHLWLVFRDEQEYDQWMNPDNADLLFKL